MKNYLIIIFFAVSLLACTDDTAVETSPNYCVPRAINLNENNFLKFNYNQDYTLLNSVTLLSDGDEITTKFIFDGQNKIASADMGEEVSQIFTYDGTKIVKAEIKEAGVVSGEKIISYSGSNISKIEQFELVDGKKEMALAYTFSYDNTGNVKKITLNIPELLGKEFTFFEGLTYGTQLSEFAGLAKYNQAFLIANTELFAFLPSQLLGNLVSKNACVKGKLSFSILEILLGALFGGLSDDEALKGLSTLEFNNTQKFNEKGFTNNNSTAFQSDGSTETLVTTTDYYCN